MGGSSEKMSATKSGLKLERGNEKQLSNNFENVKQLLDQISSPVPSAPQRKKSQQKIPEKPPKIVPPPNINVSIVGKPRAKTRQRNFLGLKMEIT